MMLGALTELTYLNLGGNDELTGEMNGLQNPRIPKHMSGLRL